MRTRIERLCKKYTNLTSDDIQIIQNEAEKLKEYRDSMEKDIFIDCPCREKTEAVVVAECLKENTPYYKSTVGCIVREADEPAVFRTFQYGIPTDAREAKVFQENESQGNMIQWVKPILNEERVVGVLIFEQCNQNIAMLSAARKSETHSTDLWLNDYMDDAVVLVNVEGIVEYRNPTASELYRQQGYLYDILGVEYKKIALNGKIELAPEEEERIEKVTSGGKFFRIKTIRLKEKQGFLIVIRDITELKLNERELILKSTAIQEIHHRIKNNLQTIMSLIQMQKRRIRDSEMDSILQDIMSRIMSISMTHEILLSKGIDEISISEVVNKLVEHYNMINAGNDCQINIFLEGDDVYVNSEMSSAIALVVNELIQNCFKYAFVGREEGNIWIHISQGFMGYANIVISDDGVGYNIDENRSSLGLSIVRNLVQDKCRGRLEIHSDQNGTSNMFDFRTK